MGKISHGGDGRGPSIMFNLRKIDLVFFFLLYKSIQFFLDKLLLTPLLSIEKKSVDLYDPGTLTKKKDIMSRHVGFFSNFLYSSITSLWIQISYEFLIFNFNPLYGHYLYPPFIPNTKA